MLNKPNQRHIMKNKYVLTAGHDMDLTFDDIIISDEENQETVPENLHPTDAQQEKFIQNCVQKGILMRQNTIF